MNMWSFFWALVVYFHLKSSSITNATTSSQPEPSTEQQSSAPFSSNTPVSVEYEVFLSFRGPDVRTNFADFLHKYLVHTKIRTFIDNEDLRKGEKMAPSLIKAIKESKVYIPILSPDYASSKWCLQELSQMVKCFKQGNGHIILPIFYMMPPRDVRHQEGSYKKAFQQHMKKFDADTINEWKEALKEVGEMKGWSVKESDGQGAVIDQVFSKVWSHLTRDYMLVTDDLIGIDLHVENMKGLLQLPKYEVVKVIGIHGMGGIGKTTVAKALYNEVFAQFERFCFVEDVRETLAKPDGVVTLQKRIISSILRIDEDIKDANEGINVIRNRICKLQVFVVLDDVDDRFKFDEILGKLEDFCLGSRFIITTRDKRVVEFFQEYEIYELGEMDEGHSLQLFSRHAFGVNNPPKEYSDLSMKFVKAAAGLPLALKVIGSLLFRKDISFWEAKLEQLKDILPSQGTDRVEVLKVDIEDDNFKLTERQFEKLSGLRYLKVNKGEFTGNFKRILPNLRWLELSGWCRLPDDMNLKKLVILRMSYTALFDDWKGWNSIKVAQKLKSISLVCCRSLRRPPNLSQCQNLEIIHFSGCKRMRGELSIDSLKNLKELYLGWSPITAITGDIGMLQKLQAFNMINLDLRELPAGMCKLSSLELLRIISDDSELKQVPALPASLKWLYLSCPCVPNFLDLKNLQVLEFSSCRPEIPGEIWKLSKLKTLRLYACACKAQLLEDSGNEISALPSSLSSLELNLCNNLEILPNLSNLINLKEFILVGTNVHEIPGLGGMRMLETLKISHSPHITHLDGLEHLILLKALSLGIYGGSWIAETVGNNGATTTFALQPSSGADVVTVDVHKAKSLIQSAHAYLDVRTEKEFRAAHPDAETIWKYLNNNSHIRTFGSGQMRNPEFTVKVKDMLRVESDLDCKRMDMWSFFWALVAFFLALAVYFHLKKSSRITNATTSSQPEPSTKQQSSASSSSNTPVSVEYEVFLSFRGPDVRTNFADFLHKYLVHTKIRTFLDDEDLRKGEKMAPSLVKAIKESKVYIPILSPDYASSKWCLQELSQMVKCCKQGNGHIILPIFYMMEPRDVRHQEGYYKKAFRQHMKKFDAETINEWKEALKEVGEMEGWSVKESDRQGAVIDQVFSKVWSHLTRDYMLVTDDLIGIDLHVENMKGLLQLPKYEAVKVIGIHGMGGIGKTTVAKALYNEVCAQFERFCFLEDVRETLAKPDGVVTLQKRIISSILRVDVDTKDANEGINVIRNRICKLKVFVVLDDADDSFKFDEILGKLEDFCLGSRFIITTRDKRVVEFFEEYEIYELGEMGEGHSLELFSRHAFGVNYPPKEYSDVSMKFVKAAAGLPLALKVIGSLLFRKDISFWEAKLEQLKDILPSQVQETLRISYLELTHEERQIFLDICCVFRGEEKELPFYMWSDCGFHPEIAITILIQRSLIKINKQDEKNVFWMHDHTRDLGRTIVREEDFRCPWKRSRIWSNEDALDMLTYEQVAHKLKSISLVSCQSLRRPPNLSQCQNLEMIHFSVCRRMRGEFSILNLKNLKELDLICTKISKLTGDTGMLQKLQEFNPLEVKLRELPAGLCKLSSLECLRLTSKDSKLKQVPALPTSLKRLYLSSPRVPNLLDLNNLEELEFYSCHDPEIPGDIWKLSKLKTLKLWVCRCKSLLVDSSENEMSALPVSLRRLVIYCCTTLERLPNLSNLSNLTDLVLTGTSVHEIPGLGEMRMLETLKISHSPHISNLDGLEQLTLLKTLSLGIYRGPWIPATVGNNGTTTTFALQPK
ncbi:Disease resistance protein L6 [Linum perenne]